MFKKILIANRGEIACRVIKTARRLGIQTVAVYSAADANARHVRLADAAVLIGPPAARDSYLQIERILAAAKTTGAEAVHPGYGFLSENAAFAAACAQADIVFIGPPVAAIRSMGCKSAAKTLLAQADVPLVPGYHGERQDAAFLQAQADLLGYPVLIKASAGGGGKGMRIVNTSAEFADALTACRRVAATSFGDERVLLETYLQRPRHIEVQVFADHHDQCVYLFERDCSVQRRHQKVLEEAPAPGMTPARRQQMGEAAVAAARAVGYVGAGTVEFIADQSGRFYFMEMNTRLQVEHPVTEMITGQDLVEWQLRVACREPLPLTQAQLRIHGHALEARIYAEDPGRGFLPSTGNLVHLALPPESSHVRVDSGVEQADDITPYYDPMIAKLIVWDHSRELALQRMRQALAQFQIVGVANNVEFLARMVECPAFVAADLDTGLIEREQAHLFAGQPALRREALLAAALAVLLREKQTAQRMARQHPDPYSPWHSLHSWRLNAPQQRTLVFRHAAQEQRVLVRYDAQGYQLGVDGTTEPARGELGTGAALRLELAGQWLNASVVAIEDVQHVFLCGSHTVLAQVSPWAQRGGDEAADTGLVAPMPGRVIALLATPGAVVDKATPLLVLEAMKMEHTITAPARGTLRSFRVMLGDQVSEGAQLVDFRHAE